MKYAVDNDLHIHSKLSECSSHPEQTKENILRYAEKNALKTICMADHFWDETVPGPSEWYTLHPFSNIVKSKPLPQSENVRFLFGCETDLTKDLVLGISKERMESFDFIIIPTTHFHMDGFTLTDAQAANAKSKAEAWVMRLNAVLDMDLPFHKIGIAHLTGAFGKTHEEGMEILSLLKEEDLKSVFQKAAKRGVGIELNAYDFRNAQTDAEMELVLRPHKIAKACGCKFYCGSDSHNPEGFTDTKEVLERAVEALGLTEADKFLI